MKRISKHLLVYWKYLGGILLLFLIQLYCSTQFTSTIYNIKQTGTVKSGIEYVLADTLSADAWQQAWVYMSDAEKFLWENCYEKQTDGKYHLTAQALVNEDMQDLENQFLPAQAVAWSVSQMSEEEKLEFFEDSGNLSATDYMEIRDAMEVKLEKTDDKEIYSNALSFVLAESEQAGTDVKTVQVQYIAGQIFKMLFLIAITVACIAGVSWFAEITIRTIGRRIQERDVRQAEQLLIYVFCMMMQAIAIFAMGIYLLTELQAHTGWYLVIGIVFLLLLIFVWLIRNQTAFENIKEIFSFSEKHRRRVFNRMHTVLIIFIPVTLLATGVFSLISRQMVFSLWIAGAELMLTTGMLFLFEIAEAADCIDESYTFEDIDEMEKL